MHKQDRSHRFLTLGTWAMIVLGWFLWTNIGSIASVILPSPQAVWRAFIKILTNGYNQLSIWQHLAVSFKRLISAVVVAIMTAVPLGLISGYFPKIRAVVDSLVQFYRPIPPLAYYALLILWMGIEDSSKIMLLFLAAFAPIYLACVAAVEQLNEDYILSAKTLGAETWDLYYRIILPATLPDIFTGVRTAIGFAYSTLVAAEMTAATSGIGWMVIDASRYLRSDVMFVGIIIMGITGVLIDVGLNWIERHYIFWKGQL